uniref:p100_1R n=1 Tax=African swine fever virus TaxID=10497 RepID=A0A6G7KTK4_ASF
MVTLFRNPIQCIFYRTSRTIQEKKLRKSLQKLYFYHPPEDCCQIYRLLQNVPGGTYFITENMSNVLFMVVQDSVDTKITSIILYLHGSYITIHQHYYIIIYMYLMRYTQIYIYPLFCFIKYYIILINILGMDFLIE